jgi:type I restriction enzyme S subunit
VAINQTESCSNQQINALIPDKGYTAFYILHLFRFHTSKILARTGSTAVPIINKTEFELIKLPILDINDIPIFERDVAALGKSVDLSRSKISSSKDLQKSLINQIF